MKLKLIELDITDFKGISSFNLNLKDYNEISGKNGTGKSSIADAFFWLFDNSNSEQRSNFNIIPLDTDGNPLNHINPTVMARIKPGNRKAITLKKVYKQVWTKRRGSADSDLTGHTTDYFFDEVPVNKKVYEDRLSEVIDPKIFRSLSDIHYFCGKTKPDFRRRILVDLIGDITDEKIMANYEELKDLPDLLAGRDIEDFKKVLRLNKKEIDKALNHIPVRINEKKHDRPDTKRISREELSNRVIELDNAITEKVRQLVELSSGGLIAEKKRQKIEFEIEIAEISKKIEAEYQEKTRIIDQKIKKYQETIEKEGKKSLKILNEMDLVNNRMQQNIVLRNEIGIKYNKLETERENIRKTCYACGQEIPEESITRQKESFDQEIAGINSQGESLMKDFAQLESEQANLKAQNQSVRDRINQLKREIETTHSDLKQISNDMLAEIEKQSAPIKERIESINQDLDKGDQDTGPKKLELEQDKQELEKMKAQVESDMHKLTEAEKIDSRIELLNQELRRFAEELEVNAYQMNLLEIFEYKKAEYIEDNVNRFFTITKWKLFEKQLNEGYRNVCEALYEGIPYSTDLNTGAKINIGLDVINSLSGHYELQCPIFIDNVESSTGLLDISNQIIALKADPDTDDLKVSHG